MLQLRNLLKKYGNTVILDIPDLQLNTGIYWIKGINGAGKTTLFKVLAGLLPYQGQIFLRGETELKQALIRHRQLINYSEAEPLYPTFLTGQELVNLVAAAKKPSPAQVNELTERLQVSAFLAQPIGSYSSGMLKKLSILLAFLGKPTLIILDEPLITLDAAAITTVNQLIMEYYQKQEISFLLSSHQNFITHDLPVTATLLLENKTLSFV
ncbi:ABC transporter [Adhaeribacter arboris]|uniref:ABC transporter n=1 Tax=Adhaeribacter arboris TaxID=2072846 RepID=A0A2T2YAN6_9BACT|nr:ATP-binding cassette domain-containing protein [Adhaeribacter arboris]PSR52546.1 ABC transporter [Adhaeribacter arboris]